MTWTATSANSEQWGELALTSEVEALDESGNVLLDESGGELVVGGVALWADASGNAEAWSDV